MEQKQDHFFVRPLASINGQHVSFIAVDQVLFFQIVDDLMD